MSILSSCPPDPRLCHHHCSCLLWHHTFLLRLFKELPTLLQSHIRTPRCRSNRFGPDGTCLLVGSNGDHSRPPVEMPTAHCKRISASRQHEPSPTGESCQSLSSSPVCQTIYWGRLLSRTRNRHDSSSGYQTYHLRTNHLSKVDSHNEQSSFELG